MMILNSTLSVIRHLICGNNQILLLNLNPIYETLCTGAKSGLFISMLEKFFIRPSFHRSNNTGGTDAKLDGSVIEEKSTFKMLGLSFSSKLDWGSYIIPIPKTVSHKIGALIRSMKFLSSEVTLYLFKSTIRPYIKYCCHVWAGIPSCYLELLDNL